MKQIKLISLLILSTALVSPCFAENVGIQNEAGKTLANTAGTSTLLATDKQGRLLLSPSIASSPFHLEDAAAASGDAGTMCLGVRNDAIASLTGANGDYSPIGTLASGAVISAIQSAWTGAAFSLAFHAEDDAFSSGDAGIAPYGVIQSALSVDAAAGDYGTLKLGLDGRLITAPAPAGETFQSCSSAATGTTDVAIKAAVASNRIYVTTLTCMNNSTVASLYNLDDGASSIYQFLLGTTTLGNNQITITFPVPLRGSVNTALNIKPTTTSTSTICCAAGYISVN